MEGGRINGFVWDCSAPSGSLFGSDLHAPAFVCLRLQLELRQEVGGLSFIRLQQWRNA
jgi:hypothetical protein